MRLTYYHGSSKVFEEFDFARLGGQSETPNARLGMFCAVDRDLAARFGDNVYAVEVEPRRIDTITVPELSFWNTEAVLGRHDFDEQRADFVAAGVDLLRLEEKDGEVAMVIITNPAVVVACRRAAWA